MSEMIPLGPTHASRHAGSIEASPGVLGMGDEELRHLLQIVRRNWPIVLFAVLVSVTAAIFYVSTRPPSYEATSRLLIIEQGAQPPSVGGGTTPAARDTLLDPVPTHIEIIRSPLVTRGAAERLGMPRERAGAIAAGLKVTQTDGTTRILRLSYVTGDPERAVATLEAVTDSYEGYLKRRYESKNKQLASLLTRARDEIQADLAGLESTYLQLRQAQIKSGLVVDEDGRPTVSGRVAEWVRGVNQALRRSVELESQLELGRELSRQGFGRTAILRAMELIGGSGRAEASGDEAGADESYHRLAGELEDVGLKHQMAEQLVARLEEEQRGAVEQIPLVEVEEALSDDPEVDRLRSAVTAAREKLDTARRVTRNPGDPSIVMALKRLSELRARLDAVRSKKASTIRQRLARSPAHGDDDALRQARSELVALEVQRATLGARLEEHRAEQGRRLSTEHDRLERQLGPEDPSVKELRERIADLADHTDDAGDEAERDKVHDLFRSLEQARRANVTMQAKLETRLKGDLEEAKRAELEMLRESNLRNSVERQRALFNTVVDQLKQVRLTDDYTSVSSEVVEPAHLVARKTRMGVAVVMSVVLGTVIGLAVAFLLEAFDTRIRTCNQLRAILDFPTLGHIPLETAADGPSCGPVGLVCMTRPRSLISETFKSIRTNLDSCRRHRAVQVILVTSPRPGDGKSTAASNLAVSFAQAGRSVLLVDADLRRPTQHDVHSVRGDLGLVHALKWQVPLERIVQPTAVRGLALAAAGPEIPDPAEALSSPRFEAFLEAARQQYDMVIIDSPPVLAVTDPCIISVLVDGIVLVVRPGGLRRQDAAHVSELLRSLETPVLGTVINGFTAAQAGFSQGYGYIYGYGEARRPSLAGGRTEEVGRSLESNDHDEGPSDGAPVPFEADAVPLAAGNSRTHSRAAT